MHILITIVTLAGPDSAQPGKAAALVEDSPHLHARNLMAAGAGEDVRYQEPGHPDATRRHITTEGDHRHRARHSPACIQSHHTECKWKYAILEFCHIAVMFLSELSLALKKEVCDWQRQNTQQAEWAIQARVDTHLL